VTIRLLTGDARDVLPTLADASVHCVVTSPPYYALRSYLDASHPDKHRELGSEPTPDAYLAAMVGVFREVRRVLRDDGVMFLNVGDSYAGSWGNQGRKQERGTQRPVNGPMMQVVDDGRYPDGGSNTGKCPPGYKPKDLMLMPARLALALQADGWWVRSDIIWAKPNPMPESVKGSTATRHMITLQEYERLSSLRSAGQRAVEQGACDLPGVQAREVSNRQAPLSADTQGDSDGQGAGRAGGGVGEAPPVLGFGTRAQEQGEIREDREGQSDKGQAITEASHYAEGEGHQRFLPSKNEGRSSEAATAQNGEQSVSANGKGQSAQTTGEGQAHRGYPRDREAADSDGVAGDCESSEGTLLLLPGEDEADAGSRNPAKQRRPAYQDERGPGVRAVQLEEERSADLAGLVPCPGCERCNNGYIAHLYAGRPTSAHEHVFLLTKRARYFYDADAVREPNSNPDLAEYATNWRERPNNGEWPSGTGGRMGSVANGRNLRNVWTIATHPYSAAHFATYPPELVERCIRAGTSERGCCAACGAPWSRITDKAFVPQPDVSLQRGVRLETQHDAANQWPGTPRGTTSATTIGWSASCACQSLRCVSCSHVLETWNARTKQSVSDVRQTGRAVGKHAPEEVLRLAMLQGVTAAENGETIGRQAVSDVRQDVSAVDSPGQILQPHLSRQQGEEAKAATVPPMRQGVYAAEPPAEKVLEALRGSMGSNQQGLNERLDDNQHRLQIDLEEGPSEREQGRIRSGASLSDGEETSSIPDGERGCPSQEWGSAGQSDQQSGTYGEAPARRTPKAGLSCDVPALSGGVPDARKCPHCGSDTEWTTPDTVPATVLDCFAGSGTTLLVADRLQRHAIGIDLSTTYADMAKNRVTDDCPLFTSWAPAEDPEDERMRDLFQDMAAD
jgi:DNA modification methylase